MKNIANEITDFLAETGIRQYRIAQASGVSSATISRLVNGKQIDLRLSTAVNIRAAMDSLRRTNAAQPHVND